MTEEAISYIMQKMSEWLDNNQMIRLEKTLEEVLRNEEVIPISRRVFAKKLDKYKLFILLDRIYLKR